RSIDGDAKGHGLATRITLAPIHTDDTVLHFGTAFVTTHPETEVDIDTPPESHVTDHDFVNTGGLGHVHRVNKLGLEAAWRRGPVSVQGEWMRTAIKRNRGYTDLAFDGWYVMGSWVITGEMRKYKNGEFKGLTDIGPSGAWELTAR